MYNHLKNEKSPYLHAHREQPVDWYPWCDAAFDRARSEDKPMFLSIGYSTCHWCHVMAEESFENPEVAEILNKNFICVKVDREERPDVDAVYMSACIAATSSGGWPLTVLMTPDGKPFFVGTYFPPRNEYGRIGLCELLSSAAGQWRNNRQELLSYGDELTAEVCRPNTTREKEPGKADLQRAVRQFSVQFDSAYGGFGGAPKFPIPHDLIFLLRYSELEKDRAARVMAERTLEGMYRGGMFDHIGGGFSRYSTDEKWLVPHFEKTLYDNALLALAYLEGARVTHRKLYRQVALRILRFARQELLSAEGAFYSGLDADSEGVEGKFYVFTPEEIVRVLGESDGQHFCRYFGITKEGNFEGQSIPNLMQTPDYERQDKKIQKGLQTLYAYREARTELRCDDKILTGWNALMITALVHASITLNRSQDLAVACRAHHFILQNLTAGNGRLNIRYRDGQSAGEGLLDDYAFYAYALLMLYRATFDIGFLEEATVRAEQMVELFYDEKAGGYFLTAEDAEQLIARPKETVDGALPSGNAVAALVFGQLAALTGKGRWQRLYSDQLRFLAGQSEQNLCSHSVALLASMEALYPSEQLLCVSERLLPPDEIRDLQRQSAALHRTCLMKTRDNAERLASIAPFTKDYPIPAEQTAYYLCRNGTCYEPVLERSALPQTDEVPDPQDVALDR